MGCNGKEASLFVTPVEIRRCCRCVHGEKQPWKYWCNAALGDDLSQTLTCPFCLVKPLQSKQSLQDGAGGS